MALQFIDLIETNGTDPSPRTSSLMLGYRGHGDGILVVGNLSHNYEWKPRRASDRDNLVDWLQKLNYEQEQTA